MAIDEKTRAEILRLHHAEKWKIGTIASQLGVHHITVRRVLADDGVPRHARRHRRSKLDPFMPFIRQTLARYPKLTASRLYQMVCERGYQGSQSHFRNMIAAERPKPAAEQLLHHQPRLGRAAAAPRHPFGDRPEEVRHHREVEGPQALRALEPGGKRRPAALSLRIDVHVVERGEEVRQPITGSSVPGPA